MDTLERAIRSALEKGDDGERAFREKVYQSAFAALERALNNPNVSPDSADTRRTALKQTIARVEGEYLAAARSRQAAAATVSRPEPGIEPVVDDRYRQDPAASPAGKEDDPFDIRPEPRHAAPEPQAPSRHASAERREPALDPDFDGELRNEYSIDADLDETVRGESRSVRRQSRRFGWWLIVTTLLALLILGAWWSYSSGLIGSYNDTMSNSGPVREAEDFDPNNPTPSGNSGEPRAGYAGPEEGAITLFTPGDQDDFTVPGDATAEVVGEDDNQVLRIRSGASGSAIAFNVPQDALSELAGQRALFLIEAQAEEGDETQISISCSFGEQGDCGGRRRFDLTGERGEIIFDVDLPDVQPGADGTIAIVSDVSNSGKAVEIFSISVSGN